MMQKTHTMNGQQGARARAGMAQKAQMAQPAEAAIVAQTV
jgi:hypothetical protein